MVVLAGAEMGRGAQEEGVAVELVVFKVEVVLLEKGVVAKGVLEME